MPRGQPEVERSHLYLKNTARMQERELHDARLDYAELFTSSSVAGQLQQRGLRVPASHERFTSEADWKVSVGEHRNRFREFQRLRRPRVLGVLCPERPAFFVDGNVDPSIPALQQLEQDFALEAVLVQLEHGHSFYLDNLASSSLWTRPAWRDLAESPTILIHDLSGARVTKVVATNIHAYSDFYYRDRSGEKRGPEALPHSKLSLLEIGDSTASRTPAEQLAHRLRTMRDFSHSACLKVLRETR